MSKGPSVLSQPAAGACVAKKPTRQPRTSKRIALRQAANIMAAVAFAREIGTSLNAHATIHWVGTQAGDDPDGRLFAKLREGFDKWLKRRGVSGGLTAIWVRERLSGGSAEVTHCHMLFHLAHPFLRGRKHTQVLMALERLIDRHGDGNYADYTIKLTFPRNPNGLYLVKGRRPEVWRRFGVPQLWRKPQGLIFGKRCGTTEDIGPAARKRRRQQQDRNSFSRARTAQKILAASQRETSSETERSKGGTLSAKT